MSLPLLHAGKSAPGLSAALDLRFALDKSLTAYRGPTPSFSRASTGTYFNSSGVLTTAAINGARFDHTFNGTSWVSRGLLVEEQRTNLAQRSDDFANAYWAVNSTGGLTVTSNSSVSPDGTTTADTIAGAPATGGAWIAPAANTAIVTGAYTFSVFIKKTSGATVFPMLLIAGPFGDSAIFCDTNTGQVYDRPGVVGLAKSSQDYGSYWRFSTTLNNTGSGNAKFYIYPAITVDFVNTNAALTGSQIYWGAQFESGAFPTSYIPTTSASTTRSADVCQITGTDFSGFWNGTEGSTAAEYDLIGVAGTGTFGMVFQVDDNTLNNRLVQIGYEAGATPSNAAGIFVANGGVAQANMYQSSIGTNLTGKASFAYKANDFALSVNGASVSTDTSGSIPTVNQMNIGRRISDGYLNGHIARLRYYRKRLPNATLQQLST